MANRSRISKAEFIHKAELSYHWELVEKEITILIDLARIHSGSVVLGQWDIFQRRFPGHPAWEFAEWFEMVMGEENES
ncbi:MAG: hypothetical protein PQJ58_15105 [Spirochaetales bacterium]|nr:hypothetical protein [Spirochaetales bacterium]